MTRTAASAVFVALALSLAACEEEGVVTYSAPPDPTRVVQALPSAGGAMNGPIPDAPPGEPSLEWTVPAGWHESENPPAFVIAAYHDASHSVQTTVSRLAGTGGGALANINRWRGQLNLPPVASLPEQPMERIDTTAGEAAGMIDLVGESASASTPSPEDQPARILGVILPRQETTSGGGAGGETWFIKMTGPRDRVEAEKQAFVELVASMKPVGSPTPQAPDSVEGDG